MKVDRLVSIILILLEKRKVSAKELAGMFEVSLRTIYRDIDAISLAGIPVYATPGVNGGFEIMPEFKVDHKVFSTNDLSTLVMGLSSLSNVIRGNELANALAKVKSFIPQEQIAEMEWKANQIRIDFHPWMGNREVEQNLDIIRMAMDLKQCVEFEYIGHHGVGAPRAVEPCQLILKESNWYLYSFCLWKNDYRIFRLSRMTRLHAISRSFVPKDFPPPRLEFDDILSTMYTEITLRIHKSIMDRVLDYCTYDRFTPDGEEHYLVRYPFIDNEYYLDCLLSFGSKCECLEPKEIRDKIVTRIQTMEQIYQ